MLNSNMALVKAVVSGAAGASVWKVVKLAIQNNVAVESTIDRVIVSAGSFVLASMAANKASDHVEETLDRAVAWYERNEIKIEVVEEQPEKTVDEEPSDETPAN